ncbi:MAG: hypothetical protein HRU36_03360 [Rickettsiales bacterium]|nr:hypothetical protein [Rickettsiales bacterium]
MNEITKLCLVEGGIKVTIIADSIDGVLEQCNQFGGTLLTHTQVLALACDGKPDNHVLLTLPAGDVTCGNYDKIYSDTEDGLDYVINYDAFEIIESSGEVNDSHYEL